MTIQANGAKFKDGDTLHFVLGSDGNYYLATEEQAKAHRHSRGTAVVSRVDPSTNTVWFSTPIPDGVKGSTDGR